MYVWAHHMLLRLSANHPSMMRTLKPNSYCTTNGTITALKNCVFVTTTAFRIDTIEPGMFDEIRQMAFAAHGVIKFLPSLWLHILLTTFSENATYLLKHIVVRYAAGPPTFLMTASWNPLHHFSVETRKSIDTTENSELHPASFKATETTSHPIAQNTKEISAVIQYIIIAAVQYNPTVNREAQIWEYTSILSDAIEQLTKYWQGKVAVSLQYHVYNQPFYWHSVAIQVNIDGHLGCIIRAERSIEPFQPDIAPVHSAPYHTGPKAREFEAAEINEMLAENVIGPAQTEWTGTIVVAPKKARAFRFCDNYCKLNAVVKRQFYPILRMDNCIDLLGNVIVFSTLDAKSGH